MKTSMHLFALLSTVWIAKHTARAADECALASDNFGCRDDATLTCNQPYRIAPPVGGPATVDGQSNRFFSTGQSFYAVESGLLRGFQLGMHAFGKTGVMFWEITTEEEVGLKELPDVGNSLGSGFVDITPTTQLVQAVDTRDQGILIEAGKTYFVLMSIPDDDNVVQWFGFDRNSDPNGIPVVREENTGQNPVWRRMDLSNSLDLSLRTIVGDGTDEECALAIAKGLDIALQQIPLLPESQTDGGFSEETNKHMEKAKKKVKRIKRLIRRGQTVKACKKIKKLESKEWFKAGDMEAALETDLRAMDNELRC